MTQSTAIAAWLPWTDRAGRTSWLKLTCFVLLIAPAGWMALEWQMGWYSPRPLTDAVRESGDWALRILVLSLAVTPLRYVTRFNRFVLVRRMLGLAALFYTLGHIVLWFVDLHFDWVEIVMELVQRLFLTVGLIATLLMAVLGVTSNDWSIRRLGAGRWNWIHKWAYAAAALSLLHYFMETRLDITEAALLTGFFVLLMAFRTIRKRMVPGFWVLAATAVVCGVATALIEAAYYWISTNVNVARVLLANLDFTYSIRPAWWVLAAGIVVAVLAFARNRLAPVANPVRRSAGPRSAADQPA